MKWQNRMRSRAHMGQFLVLALIISAMLAACERPLQTAGDGDPSPTALTEPIEPTPSGEQPPAPAPTPSPAAQEPTEAAPEATAEQTEATATVPASDESPRDDGENGDEGDEPTAEATAEPTAAATEEAAPEATVEPTAAPTAQPTEVPAGSDVERTHVVQAGENLYRIGLQYGISWTVLAEYNNIADPNSLVVGQQLRIPPAGGGAEATPAPQVTHVVQPGETLFIISQQYGVSWPDIAAANNLAAPYTIHAGQSLIIPGG